MFSNSGYIYSKNKYFIQLWVDGQGETWNIVVDSYACNWKNASSLY